MSTTRLTIRAKHFHVEGRSWWDGHNNCTKCYIYWKGECIFESLVETGSSQYYLQLAADFLKSKGFVGARGTTLYFSEELNSSYSHTEVKRRKDL